MKIRDLKRALKKFDDEADVFFEGRKPIRTIYPRARIDMRFFDGDYNGFNLVLVEDETD